MTNFLVFPKVDGAHVFPPEVRQAIADSPEVQAKLGGLGSIYASKEAPIPTWNPSVIYKAGQQVISPNGDLVSSVIQHTSGSSFNPSNWKVSTTFTTPDAVTAQVPPLVAASLAKDSTVSAAAASAASAAVGTALTTAGVVSGGVPIVGNDAVAFTIVGQGNRRSWVEIGQDGRPTPEAANLIARAAAPIIDANGLLPTPQTIGDGPGLSFVIVDSAGHKSELQIGTDGKLVGPFPDRILSSAVAAASNAFIAKTPIICWGDSLTESGYNNTLSSELGVPAINYGIGGQSAASIAARQGGTPALVTVASNTIPTSGAVSVTTDSTPYSSPSGTGTSSGHGKLAGISGILTRDNVAQTVTFTRDASGVATWCAPKTPWMADEAPINRNQVTVFWAGRNGFTIVSPESIIAYIQSMVAYLTLPEKRFLVLEVPPFAGEEILPSPTANRIKLDTLNAALLAAFPRDFVPIAQYLRGPAISDMGLTYTSQDNTDISNGLTPTTLRGSDPGHPNPQGNVAIGKYLAKIMKLKGWF